MLRVARIARVLWLCPEPDRASMDRDYAIFLGLSANRLGELNV
jgi:hypothetical protein